MRPWPGELSWVVLLEEREAKEGWMMMELLPEESGSCACLSLSNPSV